MTSTLGLAWGAGPVTQMGKGAGKASGRESEVNLQVCLGAEKEEEGTLSRE